MATIAIEAFILRSNYLLLSKGYVSQLYFFSSPIGALIFFDITLLYNNVHPNNKKFSYDDSGFRFSYHQDKISNWICETFNDNMVMFSITKDMIRYRIVPNSNFDNKLI